MRGGLSATDSPPARPLSTSAPSPFSFKNYNAPKRKPIKTTTTTTRTTDTKPTPRAAPRANPIKQTPHPAAKQATASTPPSSPQPNEPTTSTPPISPRSPAPRPPPTRPAVAAQDLFRAIPALAVAGQDTEVNAARKVGLETMQGGAGVDFSEAGAFRCGEGVRELGNTLAMPSVESTACCVEKCGHRGRPRVPSLIVTGDNGRSVIPVL